MSGIKRSVREYTVMYLPVSFPTGQENCKYCPSIRLDRTTDAHYCNETGEKLLDWKSCLGAKCTLLEFKLLNQKEG